MSAHVASITRPQLLAAFKILQPYRKDTDYHRLLPDVWKQSHPEAVRTYREQERRDKAERKSLRAANRRIGTS